MILLNIRFLYLYDSYVNVELEGLDGFFQHFSALHLAQFNAVHSASVQLLETIRTRHSRKAEEWNSLISTLSNWFLGDFSKNLASRKVSQVTGVSMGN